MAVVKLVVSLCFLILENVTASSPSCTSNQTLVEGDDPCPPWQTRNITTGVCECEKKTASDVVVCTDNPYQLTLHECYCMTYRDQILVGPCFYTCNRGSDTFKIRITVDSPCKLNDVMCARFERRGQMCGKCSSNYAPPVYSYTLSCVNCTTSNWGKYTAVSLLPLTAFFVFVVIFRISATSPKLHGFILFSQIVTYSSNMRAFGTVLPVKSKFTPTQKHLTQALLSFPDMWNLDFFRLFYTPFCLHPRTTNLDVLAMDYIPAVYPLLLIGLSYFLVLRYDRNARLVVWLCKPLVSLSIRFRRQWNIRNSLVDAFATFLLLSYVRILSVSVDLLLPVALYRQNGQQLPQLYLFNQGDVAYFSSQHLPYACLALFFLLTFTLLPMALLFLYPCSCFQVCLNRTGLSCQSLHIFMDSFQGHLKNGTKGTRDFRSFSAIHLLFRVVVYISLMFAYQVGSYASTSIIVLCFTAITALAQPYKRQTHNFIEVFCLVMLTFATLAFLPQSINNSPLKRKSLMLFNFILIVFLVMYQPTIVILLVKPWKLVSQVWLRMQLKIMTTLPNRQGYGRLLN